MAVRSTQLTANPAAEKNHCEFFAGIGLVRAGLEPGGWKCVYANDIEPKKAELYLNNFADGTFHLEDVWNTDRVVSRIPGVPFLATASFPCIDLSLAGHWTGLDGKHSSTFFAFIKVLQALGKRAPRMVLLENVTGLLTSQNGRDFRAVAVALAEQGYWLDAVVLDAKHFLPQSRPRVFIVGVKDHPPAGVAVAQRQDAWFADAWTDAMALAGKKLRPPKLVEAMRDAVLPTGWMAYPLKEPRCSQPALSRLIDSDDSQDWWDEEAVRKHHDMMSDRHRATVDGLIAASRTAVGTIYRRKRYGKTRAEVRFDGTAGCLRTPKGGSARQIVIVIDKGRLRMRWMSPREYARLQGADSFRLVKNTNQNLYGFGDGVCVPVIEWIDRHVLTPNFNALTRGESLPSHGFGPRPASAAGSKK